MLVPAKDDFLRLCSTKSSQMAVYRDILADFETPLSAYWKLAHSETYSFLLESVTGGEQLARYSILGVRPRKVIRTKGDSVRVFENGLERDEKLEPGQDPLDILKEAMTERSTIEVPGLPKFAGGAVGTLGYDIARFFERLPDKNVDDLEFDDLAMMIADTVVVFDHAKNLIRIVVMSEGSVEGYDQATATIEAITMTLKGSLPDLPSHSGPVHPVQANVTQGEYEAAVEKTKQYIAQGDGIQMVISQRFSTQLDAHPLTVYRALRSINPSPYMFLLRFGDFDLVGASPEILVGLDADEARVRPIAGTRWRSADPVEDDRLAAELLADEKELAEHIMLVDLGRNDLGRVSTIGSVRVNELMAIERYSHVMHIVSDVTSTLDPAHDAYSLTRASFPAGTVSGAPKVRAMQIIDELEQVRRGPYAGAVGYFSYGGNSDLCIAIRTILIKGGKAYVQAGAGIVHDSVPSKEYEETKNKARACLRAIEMAQVGLDA